MKVTGYTRRAKIQRKGESDAAFLSRTSGSAYKRRFIGKAKARAGLTALVKRVVARQEETKYVTDVIEHNVPIGQAATTPGSFKRLLPTLLQGVEDHQRIGDVIKPVRCTVTLSLRFTNEQSNNQDAVVHCYIVRCKGAFTAAAVASLPAGEFLKVGNGSNRDPNDPDQPIMLTQVNTMPLNTDQYTLMKKYQFVMRRGTGAQANQGPATIVAPTGVPAREDFRQVKYSWVPPKLKYNLPASNLPTNHYPVLLWWATNRDGSAYGDTIHSTIRTEMYYKDA